VPYSLTATTQTVPYSLRAVTQQVPYSLHSPRDVERTLKDKRREVDLER